MTKGFTVQNWKGGLMRHPIEDSYSIDGENKVFTVADGVTRDPLEYLPDTSKFLGKLKFSMNYPKYSLARQASDIFAKGVPIFLHNFEKRDENTLRQVFKEANNAIGKLNFMVNPWPDYVVNDLAGCVGSVAIMEKDYIVWGYITDCGVAIFNENGDLKFQTPEESPHKLDKYIWADERIKGKSWRESDVRKIIRSEYRNNPGNPHSFGVLTGDGEAMDYVRTGTEEISPKDYLIVYSDGLKPILDLGEFRDKLRKKDFKGLEKICKKNVSSEGTLILN